MRPFISVFLCTIAISFGQAQAYASTKLTGIFSNMTYNEEGGDVLGVEIFIVYSKNGYMVVFQESEGEPCIPVVVTATIKGEEIYFKFPSEIGYGGEFEGRFVENGIIGSFKNGLQVELKRKNSYWQ